MPKIIKRITPAASATALELAVTEWLNEQAAEYDSGIAGVIQDLQHGGCASGFVSHLIRYHETTAFYQAHKKEINALLSENAGVSSPKDLFGDKWDTADPLAEEVQNQNLLAWFGFEETAFRVAGKYGIDT